MKIVALSLLALLCLHDAGAFDVTAFADAVRRLGDDDFARREAGAAAILSLANENEDQALVYLNDARKTVKDPEVRARLGELIAKLNVAGKPGWNVEAGSLYQLPAVNANRVYVGNKDNFVYCLDAFNGRMLWKYAVGGFIFKSLAVDDGRVFLIRTRKDGRPDGRLIALDASDGRELWSWQDQKKSQYFSAPIASQGAVYFARETQLFALDALEGTLKWSFDAEDSIVSPPSVAGHNVVFGTLGGAIVCLNRPDGKSIWRRDFPGEARAGGVIFDESVFAGAGSTLYRLNLKTGEPLWEFPASEAVIVSPAVTKQAVYAAFGQTLRRLDARTGRQEWALDTGGHIFASPALAAGRLYAGSLNDKLTMFCLNPADGSEIWTHVTKEGGYAEPILAGRQLFMGYHGKFYTLKTGLTGPASWPMSGGNSARTGAE